LTLLNPTTLAEIWKSQLPAKPAAAAVQTENMALIPLANNVLTALSLRTGIAAWRFETRFLTAASATATDQVTIFGNTAGSIYAIK
jgi:outer membrane protein assembly factor BamB